jgi:hypothetical protein
MRNAQCVMVLAALIALSMAFPAGAAVKSSDLQLSSAAPVRPGFIANAGQIATDAVCYVRTPDCAAYFGRHSVLFDKSPAGERTVGVAVRVSFPNGAAIVEPGRQRCSNVNVFSGRDPARWQRSIASYEDVRYRDIAPGTDIVYRQESDGRMKYDVLIQPGAEPSKAVLRYEGVQRLDVGSDGGLLIRTGAGTLCEQPPFLYQEIAGSRVPVQGGYRIAGMRELSFWAKGYDPGLPLVIDPGLRWSTYVGGSGVDQAFGVVSDASGNIVIVGTSASADAPTTPGVYQSTNHGQKDALITKMSGDGSAVLWCTLLGGSGNDMAERVKLDAGGNIVVVGGTASADFPVTANAAQRTYGGGMVDAFVAKLSPNGGNLIYSSYLGGSSEDIAYGVALDASGNMIVGGFTNSTNLPVTPGVVKTSYVPTFGNTSDGFVAKLNAAGSLVYCTYLGGANGEDAVMGVAVDASGRAVVTGYSGATNYPTTAGAFDQTQNVGYDVVVTKLNETATGYVFSTFLGGSQGDRANAIALDAAGNIYVAGGTGSSNFPVTSHAFQPSITTWDGFVAKLNPTGSSLLYCTALGGGGADECMDITLADGGVACVTGETQSTNFPTTSGAVEKSNSGGTDAFATAISADGSALVYSTYLGGTGTDWGEGIVLKPSGDVVTVGYTDSGGYPTSRGAYDGTIGSSGVYDAYVSTVDMGVQAGGTTAVAEGPALASTCVTAAPNPFLTGTSFTLALSKPAHVAVRIFDMQGRMVRELPDLDLAAGAHQVGWDGRGADGAELSPGKYFAILSSEDGRRVASVVKLR